MTAMRVLVLGTGALGTLFAARLARAGGARVTIAGGWAAAREAIARRGAILEGDGDGGSTAVALHAVDYRALAPPYDLVLVLTKSWQTAAVAPVAAAACAAAGLIVTLQNGLGNVEALARAAGPARIAGGSTGLGATLLRPGRVRLGGAGTTVLARHRPAAGGGLDLDAVAATLRAAGFATRLAEDLDAVVWAKLSVNCAINPLTALAGCDNGALLASPRRRRAVVAVADEVAAVARAAGVALGEHDPSRALAVARATAGNRSSMRQDLERGRRTEIDALNGAVAELAERLGGRAPHNAFLAARVRAREAAGGAGRGDDLDALAAGVLGAGAAESVA